MYTDFGDFMDEIRTPLGILCLGIAWLITLLASVGGYAALDSGIFAFVVLGFFILADRLLSKSLVQYYNRQRLAEKAITYRCILLYYCSALISLCFAAWWFRDALLPLFNTPVRRGATAAIILCWVFFSSAPDWVLMRRLKQQQLRELSEGKDILDDFLEELNQKEREEIEHLGEPPSPTALEIIEYRYAKRREDLVREVTSMREARGTRGKC